jgi:hypothetical protein
MAKTGEFASVPDGLFGDLVTKYETDILAGSLTADQQLQVKTLALMAREEHAAATATLEPNVIELAMACIDLQGQLATLKNAKSTPVEISNAHDAIDVVLTKLRGLWRDDEN